MGENLTWLNRSYLVVAQAANWVLSVVGVVELEIHKVGKAVEVLDFPEGMDFVASEIQLLQLHQLVQ